MEFFFLTSFLLANFCYIKIWNKFSDKVPTGVGILLIVPSFFYYFNENIYFINIGLIFIFSLIYFLDDVIEIHFSWRIILQILGSLIVYFSFSLELNFIMIFLTVCIFLILINTLNFQDGEDLNISILLIIIFGIFYLYTENKFILKTSEIILFFLISFSFFNSKKKNLYFGDSSCYIISIIISIFVYEEMKNLMIIKLLVAVILYPIIDVFYVVVYRILKKENLLSRNYLHLYQIIAQKVSYKIYLLPNILFSTLNIFISFHFFFSLNLIVFLIVLNISLVITTRLIIKNFTD